MRSVAFFAFALLLPIAPLALAGGDDAAAPEAPSPLGLWRLDRDSADLGVDEDEAATLLLSLLVPDLEIRIHPDGRFVSRTRRSGDGEATLSRGTWVQSGNVLSLAALRDDGQPGSVIGRLRDGRLVLSMGTVELPLLRVEDSTPPPVETGEETGDPEDDTPSIGLGPGTSISLPWPEKDDGAWPPPAITAANARRVARRLAAEVLAASSTSREVDPEHPWPGVLPHHVVHVRSDDDALDAILDGWRLPHVDVTVLELLEQGGVLLPQARVVLLSSMETLPRALENGLAQAIRHFVEGGGHLLTTDGSVRSVLEPAFPDLVKAQEERRLEEGLLCPSWVPPLAKRDARVVAGLPASEGITLWCEASSCPFETVEEGTITLVATNRLHLTQGLGRVLVFSAERKEGKVLHAMPHLFQKRGAVDGARLLQRLALDFIAEALSEAR